MRTRIRQLAEREIPRLHQPVDPRDNIYPMKPIVKVPHEVLNTKAGTISRFDKRLALLIAEMKRTLIATKNPKGVGLAAPQVGESLRLFITRPTPKDPVRVFINGTITAYSDEVLDEETRKGKLEGCLSIPLIWGNVRRSKTVTLKFQDEAGASHQESFEGFLATIIQHETDHINGILFTQRVLEQKNPLYQAVKDKEGKEVLEEIHI